MSSAEPWEQEQTYKHCANWEQCHDRWADECPDARIQEPWEWCGCSIECDGFREDA